MSVLSSQARAAPCIKGEAVRQFVQWHRTAFGPERFAQHLSRLPPEHRRFFQEGRRDFGIISSDWYPAETFHALIETMLEGYTPEQRDRFARQVSKVTVEASLRGVYRFLFEAIMTPERYANRAQKLFSRFYNTGRIHKTIVGPKHHRTVIEGWTSHHPVLCDGIMHTSEFIYPALGCKNVVVERLTCISTGGAACSYDVTWT